MVRFCFLLILASLTASLGAQSEGFKQPIEVGAKAPAFEGTDQNNEIVTSEKLLEKGQIVMVFYRGAWCPYCREHISALQDSLQQILDKGASVVIITPEKPKYIDKMVSKTNAKMSILYDEGYKIMKDYKVDFQISEETVPNWRGFVTTYTRSHSGNKEDILPIPATYIIGRDGNIKYVQFDPDYKKRSSVETILKQLN